MSDDTQKALNFWYVKARELEIQVRDYEKALEQINKEEMNGMRPGGSPSRAATLSYEILKKYGKSNAT